MTKHRIKFWTGPTLVQFFASKFKEAQIDVDCEGTEHIYVNIAATTDEAARWDALAALCKTHGQDWGLR